MMQCGQFDLNISKSQNTKDRQMKLTSYCVTIHTKENGAYWRIVKVNKGSWVYDGTQSAIESCYDEVLGGYWVTPASEEYRTFIPESQVTKITVQKGKENS